MTHLPSAPIERWSGLEIGTRITVGNRAEVWKGFLDDRRVAVRRSRRSAASLDWEIELLSRLDAHGFVVPAVVPTDDGQSRVAQWTVQTWIDGSRPTSTDDWHAVFRELRRLHRTPLGLEQRPGACSVAELGPVRRSVDADLDATPDVVVRQCLRHFPPIATTDHVVIHGDPGADNLRMTDDGRVGLLDWDESRIDSADLDMANLGISALEGRRRHLAELAAHAWETLNAWTTERGYAEGRLVQLTESVHGHR